MLQPLLKRNCYSSWVKYNCYPFHFSGDDGATETAILNDNPLDAITSEPIDEPMETSTGATATAPQAAASETSSGTAGAPPTGLKRKLIVTSGLTSQVHPGAAKRRRSNRQISSGNGTVSHFLFQWYDVLMMVSESYCYSLALVSCAEDVSGFQNG